MCLLLQAVRREVELMLAFNHPNIVRAYVSLPWCVSQAVPV
jgi:hypothetical protein